MTTKFDLWLARETNIEKKNQAFVEACRNDDVDRMNLLLPHIDPIVDNGKAIVLAIQRNKFSSLQILLNQPSVIDWFNGATFSNVGERTIVDQQLDNAMHENISISIIKLLAPHLKRSIVKLMGYYITYERWIEIDAIWDHPQNTITLQNPSILKFTKQMNSLELMKRVIHDDRTNMSDVQIAYSAMIVWNDIEEVKYLSEKFNLSGDLHLVHSTEMFMYVAQNPRTIQDDVICHICFRSPKLKEPQLIYWSRRSWHFIPNLECVLKIMTQRNITAKNIIDHVNSHWDIESEFNNSCIQGELGLIMIYFDDKFIKITAEIIENCHPDVLNFLVTKSSNLLVVKKFIDTHPEIQEKFADLHPDWEMWLDETMKDPKSLKALSFRQTLKLLIN